MKIKKAIKEHLMEPAYRPGKGDKLTTMPKMTVKKTPATLNKTKMMVVDSGSDGWLKLRKRRMGH